MSSLAGKVALVTGSSRGIGAAIAREFAKEGASVALHGRDRAALGDVADVILSEGKDRRGPDRGHWLIQTTGDVTNFSDIEAMRAEVEASLGPVDILVTNAGGSLTKPGPLENIPEDGWHASVNANLGRSRADLVENHSPGGCKHPSPPLTVGIRERAGKPS